MTPLVSVVVGPPVSGKTAKLLDRYRQVLRQAGRDGAAGRVLWLAPTVRGASAVRRMLLAGVDACLGPAVLTFDELVDRVLAASGGHFRRVSPCMQRALLARLVDQAVAGNRLDALQSSAGRPGFVDLLVEHLRELRRRGVSPQAYADAAARSSDHRAQLVELSHLYDEYDRLLRAGTMGDQEGRHWAARDRLAADDTPWPGRLELVVADGFADFTPIQHEVLQLLARRAAQLLVSLPGEAAGGPLSAKELGDEVAGREDLFAKSQAALDEIQRRHAQVEVVRLPSRPGGWPALDYLGANLFRNPRRVAPPSPEAVASLDRLVVVAAAGAHDEIVQLARRVKRELVSGGAAPGDLLVVFRSLGSVARRVREVFGEFGIPYALESGQPLLSAPFIRTLLAVLRLDLDDWPYRRAVSVITNSRLTALDDEARAAADWLVRALQIAAGRHTLLGRVEQLAALPLPDEEGDGRATTHQRRTAAAAALPALQQIAAALDRLPKSATHTEWAAALHGLAVELGFAPPADDDADSPGGPITLLDTAVAEDRAAWQRVNRGLRSLDRLAAWLGEPAPDVSRGEILRVLVDLATHESLPAPHDEMGRVRVLSATTARTVRARHVFLAGMSEQAFPSPERVGRLATEADYQRYAGNAPGRPTGRPVAAVQRSQEEMLLFYEVLTRATERITISYPALDDRAQSLPASPYVVEIEHAFDPHPLRHVVPRLSAVPAETVDTATSDADSSAGTPVPLGPTDWRVLAVHGALAGQRQLLADLLADRSAPVGAAVDAGLRAVHDRAGRHEFSPAEGLLTSPAIRRRLAQRFGPQHLWSPSQWEQYATCPYRFFLEHVLGLEPLGELTLETDFAHRGSLLHRVLAAFHRRLRDALGELRVPSQQDEAQFQAEFKAAVTEALAATSAAGLDAALLELDRRQIDRWSEGYFAQHAKYDHAWPTLDQPPVPAHFEVRFGPPHSGAADDDDPRSTSLPFVLELGNEQIRITGRIDRIDVGRAGGRTVFNVIDYKSGRKPSLKAEHIESGERLQLPLYVMAAQHLLLADDSATPLAAGYWTMQGGFDDRGSLKVSQFAADALSTNDQWRAIEPVVVERVAQFVDAIRHGDFPVYSRDDHCTSRCPFRTVCRIAQVRSLGKVWPPEEESEPAGDL